eukprot:128750_1
MGTKQSKSSKLEDYVPTMTQNEYNMLKELEQSSNVSCKYDKQCKIFMAAKHYLSTKENMEHLYSFKHSRDKCKYAANCFAYNRVASSDSKSYAYEDLCHNMLYYHTNDDENKNEINTSKSVALSADEIENLLQLIPNTDCPDEEKCAIYNNVRDGKEINKDNYIHLKSLNHKRNICTDGEECKYWDAFKNKSKALEDICHCTIFYHPSSRSNIIYDKMESVNDFITHDNLGVLCCNGVCGSTLSKLLKSVCLTKWKNYHYKLVNNQSDKVNTDGILEWIRVHGFAGFVEFYYPIMNDKEVIEFLHHVLSLILNTDQIGILYINNMGPKEPLLTREELKPYLDISSISSELELSDEQIVEPIREVQRVQFCDRLSNIKPAPKSIKVVTSTKTTATRKLALNIKDADAGLCIHMTNDACDTFAETKDGLIVLFQNVCDPNLVIQSSKSVLRIHFEKDQSSNKIVTQIFCITEVAAQNFVNNVKTFVTRSKNYVQRLWKISIWKVKTEHYIQQRNNNAGRGGGSIMSNGYRGRGRGRGR